MGACRLDRAARGAALLLGLACLAPAARAQTAAADAPVLLRPEAAQPLPAAPRGPKKTPGGALLRSLLVPGWGQLYVGQWYKAPLAAGGVGFMGYTLVQQQRHYLLYRRAFRYVEYEDADPAAPDEGNPYAADYASWLEAGRPSAATAQAARNTYRRNRTVMIFGTAVVYALQALDAYVAGQLLDFDVSEDLSLRVAPAPGGLRLSATW